jgi:hypothetical protein
MQPRLIQQGHNNQGKVMTATVRPKESKAVLEPTKGTFAVANGVLFDYYTIKFGEQKGNYVTLEKLPPVLKEGYATYQRKLYKVELRDFLRSRVNVGQSAYTPNATPDTGGSTTATPGPASPALVNPNADSIQSAVDGTFGVQVNQAADLAWKDQISALLHAYDPEEEWIVETTPQP